MSDQCKHCTLRGSIKECLSEECSILDSWVVQYLRNHGTEPADEKNTEDTGVGCSVCHGTPAVNVTGTYWLCGPCVMENHVAHHVKDATEDLCPMGGEHKWIPSTDGDGKLCEKCRTYRNCDAKDA